VLQNEKESVYCCGAETLTSKNNLAVSVLVDVLDETVAAIESAPNAVHQILHWDDSGLCVHVLHFFVDVFENYADHAHNSNNKRAK
jgi:hypothetical protein